MIGHDKDIRCRSCPAAVGSVQRGEHAREVIVTGSYRGYRCWRAWRGFMLGVIGFTEPQQRKLGNALLPKNISQRLRCPCIAIGRLRRRRKCSEHFYDLSDGLGRNRFAAENILSGPSICMSIQQETDSFSGRDRRFSAAVVD